MCTCPIFVQNCLQEVVRAQAAALVQGLLARKPEQRLTASKALHAAKQLSEEG